MSSEPLQQAYRLIREGNKPDAARLLLPIVRADPLNADAWWLLANALENTRQQESALKRVLSLRPNDERAKQMLDRLQASAAASASVIAPANELPLGDVRERKSRPVNLLLIIIGLLTIVSCVACLGVVALSGSTITGIYSQVVLTITAMPQSFAPLSGAATAVVATAVPTLPPDLHMQGSISVGQTVSNTVATFQDDGWTFSASANEHVSIELDAVDPALDPHVYLYAQNGQLVADNDDINGATDRNSRLDITLPTAGAYTIRVGKFSDGGAYRLTVESTP